MWNAMRCAPLGPTPGSRPSSSMRSWTTPSYTAACRRPLLTGETEGAETLRALPHHLSPLLGRGPVGVAYGGDDEIRECLRVLRVDRLGGDRETDEFPTPGDRGPDEAATGTALDLGAVQREQILLHLLHLLKQ